VPKSRMTSSLTLASLPRRALALLIDWLIIGCPVLLNVVRANYEFMHGYGEAFRALFPSLALIAVNDWMLVAMRGQSVGKIILGIAVVHPSGEYPTWWLAFIRTFTRFGIAGMLFCLAPIWFLIDALPMLFNANRQTIHDMTACTYVCRVAGGKRVSNE
jgi:uncharacterized RDD family membrane protein YckC